MAKTKLTARIRRQRIIRTIIQVAFFALLPSAYSAAFAGVKYIFSMIGVGERIEWTSLLAILVVLVLYTIIFGRFFCGYACAFGALNDWLFLIHLGILKKRKKRVKRIARRIAKALELAKYVVLVAILVMVFAGSYSSLQGTSPWDVFSLFLGRRLPSGRYWIGFGILVALMVGMFFEERFFCRFLCPMGAIFSILPSLPAFTLRRDRPNCIRGCHRCEDSCPAGIELPTDGSWEVRGECIMCGTCGAGCPKQNIHCGCGKIKGNEIWFVLLRAALLFALLRFAGA